jgi:diaminopimelate decarboxylase
MTGGALLDDTMLRRVAATYPTPFYLYDEAGLRQSARDLVTAFGAFEGFREFFAVKATPNPHVLAILRDEGLGADCSSLAELLLAERAGIGGEQIMFTSNNTPAEEFTEALRLQAIINLDDIGLVPFLAEHAGVPPVVALRYNPGAARTGNAIIGEPQFSKFGVTHAQLFEGYRLLREHGVARFGLHTMVASNELDPAYIVATAQMLFDIVVELHTALDLRVEFVNIGGGIGIPYQPGERAVDLAALAHAIHAAYERTVVAAGLAPLRLYMECGRVVTGPHGVLVTRVRHVKHSYRRYVGVDATMADLMRPGMYGAYHHITAPGKEHEAATWTCDVVGSLCENNDKFAIDRALPPLEPGDLLVIHDAGAHGRAMGFNYNGKLRPAELLLRPNGDVTLIRRRETLDDLFATIV